MQLFWMISIPTLSVYSLSNLYTNWYNVVIQVGVSMGNLTDLQLCSPIFNKLRSTVYSGTYFSYSNSVGWDHMGKPSLITCINEPHPPMTLLLVPHCFFLGPLLILTTADQ